MSDKPDKKPDAPAAEGHDEKKPAKAGGALLSKTPVLMGAVMLIEAVVLIGGFKFLAGGPKHADAGAVEGEHGAAPTEGGHDDGHGGGGGEKSKDKKKVVELPLLEFRATNKMSGKTLIFDVKMSVNVRAEHEEAVKKSIADRKGLISDRVRTIIAQSDPDKLNGSTEPGLETLRRQVRYQLDQILDREGMVEEVLVPGWLPFRADL